ncbi:hypothetical protein TVAG_365630 [Trichomonas vaginalis G3]|uniref:DUF3447 domain-containing protein n=1 Tax=Trichomonas vaginalis (strain ATCC PRA-98 / G3) TaxID=412133 RepID=A2DHK7_TRIV3|nr:nerve growth factor signaling pathway [Trichomonas vaginalis G3]EAY20055.1 hypothetical protein TVAG_365630 [Trichomonas vaginalis G3]KAI5528007.1 nerve growth factor signaling pathway [Trichomonas vaginalis G3]|eukprot:XP_001581041.1 hypothetical protein [Trichomonas vaginalis G3]
MEWKTIENFSSPLCVCEIIESWKKNHDLQKIIAEDNEEELKKLLETGLQLGHKFYVLELGCPLEYTMNIIEYSVFRNSPNCFNLLHKMGHRLDGCIKTAALTGNIQHIADLVKLYTPTTAEIQDLVEICIRFQQDAVLEWALNTYNKVKLTDVDKLKFAVKYNNFQILAKFIDSDDNSMNGIRQMFKQNYSRFCTRYRGYFSFRPTKSSR